MKFDSFNSKDALDYFLDEFDEFEDTYTKETILDTQQKVYELLN